MLEILEAEMSKTKKDAWKWCSRYIRLRDSIEYCKQRGISLDSGIVQCCTCDTVKQWKYVDAGHFIGRGLGGGSGVYFDERNIHAQCKRCNAFEQGNAQVYELFIFNKYSQDVVEELRIKHHTNNYKGKLWAIGQMYKKMYKDLQEMES